TRGADGHRLLGGLETNVCRAIDGCTRALLGRLLHACGVEYFEHESRRVDERLVTPSTRIGRRLLLHPLAVGIQARTFRERRLVRACRGRSRVNAQYVFGDERTTNDRRGARLIGER